MSPVYDNWGRLVAAVMRNQQIWELFHEQSSISSASSDSSFSFQLNSSLQDVFSVFSSPSASDSYQKEYSVSGLVSVAVGCVVIGSRETDAGNPSSIPVNDQSPGNLSPNSNVSSLPRRKRILNVQVPNRQFHNDDDLVHTPNSSENYPNHSPRRHLRNGESHSESPCNWPDYGKQRSFPLPLPPTPTSNSSPPFSHSRLPTTSSLPRSPGRMESHISSGSHWKKGKLLCNGEYGNIYMGFNSITGEMCSMKEVPFSSNDPKSTRTFKQLMQEIQLLSCLKHPNIGQYYDSEVVHDKFYIYLEYVAGGSIDKILKQYGNLREPVIRSYTKQILAGLAYLHAEHTVHRNIRGASILVDPNGCLKLVHFGMAKHGSQALLQIATQSSQLFPKDNLYWMAPEVIRNSNVCNQAVDIWSLGCTVMEMATSKPPWSQYGEAVATFKIVNSKELPVIPDYLSDACKNFIRQCLQWNPLHRPTVAQLLKHPFLMKCVVSPGNQVLNSTSSDHVAVTSAISMGIDYVKTPHQLDSESLGRRISGVSKSTPSSRNISRQGSPVGTPLQHPRSPQHLKGALPSSSKSTSRASSGSSTPTTGGSGGAFLCQRPNQSMLLQDPKCPSPTSPPGSSLAYWDPSILHRLHPVSHALREPESSAQYAQGKQFGKTLVVDKFMMGS